MKCLVIGGGNIAHSLAAVIARREEVAVLTRRPVDWSSHLNDSPFVVRATDDPSVVACAEILFIALPGFALDETVRKISPYLHSGQTICMTPANALIPDLIPRFANKGVDLVCLQRVPFISRIEDYGRYVRMASPRALHKLYVPREELKPLWTVICREFFGGRAMFLRSPLTFVFNNSNPILHPSRLVVLFRDWRKKSFLRNPPFYAEWTDESSEFYIKADAEMHAVLRVADPTGACEADYESVLAHYGVGSAAELTAKIRSIESFREILSPMREREDGTWVPDFESRYFTEDVVGARAIQSFARRYNVATPVIDGLLSGVEALRKG